MTAKPRRWFSFSLRTMFVVVTALCCWLAWEMSIVRARQAMLLKLKADPAVQITTAAGLAQRYPPGATLPPPARIPAVQRWLGDEAIQEIAYDREYHRFSRADIDRTARTFPEAKLREYEIPKIPCHPGCFPRGTLVDTPQGPRAIEAIQPGDDLVAILPDGTLVTISVQLIFVTTNRLWKVETEEGILFTTQTQPLCLAFDRHVLAGDLQPGDQILRRTIGEIHAVNVLAVSPTDRSERVFNLVLGNREVFMAAGFLARSKPPAQ